MPIVIAYVPKVEGWGGIVGLMNVLAFAVVAVAEGCFSDLLGCG